MVNFQRYIDEDKFQRVAKDIEQVIRRVKENYNELDLQIRCNKFNLYFRGNSLAKIEITSNKDIYRILVNKTFKFPEIVRNSFELTRFDLSGDYDTILVNSQKIGRYSEVDTLFRQDYINALVNNIKKNFYQEEIVFEQALLADNMINEICFPIDRQIQGGNLGTRNKIDLLFLRKLENSSYGFLIGEVKLGNNPDLDVRNNEVRVINQVEKYSALFREDIASFKNCYEINYKQKKEMGLLPEEFPNKINIDENVDTVDERIIVLGYSNRAKEKINKIIENYPHYRDKFIQFNFKLTIIGNV